jgi:hypothetical protein
VALTRDPTILDACCVLTLYGSGHMREVLALLPGPVYVSEYVAEEEALTVYDGPPGDIRSEKTDVELEPLLEEEIVEITSLQSDERDSFLQLAQLLDDGEARTLAISASRGWAIGTDDKRALKVCRQKTDCQPVTTPEFMRHWAESSGPPQEKIERVLRDIYARAVYLPGSSHPEYEWWEKNS